MPEPHSLPSLEQTVDLTPSAKATAKQTIDVASLSLFEQLGVGGMGEVYRCGDTTLQRDLAVKVIKAELRGAADAEERFIREARLTGALQHPGIVPIHQLGRLADGRLCYTMKLVRGHTFAELLRGQADDPERLPRGLAILDKVCQAVAYAHSKGVIHRTSSRPTSWSASSAKFRSWTGDWPRCSVATTTPGRTKARARAAP